MAYKDKTKAAQYRLKWQRANKEKMKEYRIKYQQSHPDKLKESLKKWRNKNPKYRKQYYEENKEKELHLAQQWRKENKTKTRKYSKIHYEKNSEKIKDYARKNYVVSLRKNRYERTREESLIYAKKLNEKKRTICIWHYSKGTYECACCGLKDDKIFYDIDHIKNNGNKHRKIIGRSNLHGWLVKNNLPEGYQVLCSNCNQGKNRNKGICPHQLKVK